MEQVGLHALAQLEFEPLLASLGINATTRAMILAQVVAAWPHPARSWPPGSGVASKRQDVFICRTTNAPYASSAHLHKGVWVPTLDALGIAQRRMYQTCHTFATMNLMAGANPAWIAEQLGHSNARLVFTTYSKWIKAADKLRQKGLLDSWLANS